MIQDPALKADQGRPVNAFRTVFTAFGAEVELEHGDDEAETQLRLDELRRTHEPFLASRAIPKSGLCLDIGAGEGWFGLPFAKAFPNWQVLCLEPDPAAFARLHSDVADESEDVVQVVRLALVEPALAGVQRAADGGAEPPA